MFPLYSLSPEQLFWDPSSVGTLFPWEQARARKGQELAFVVCVFQHVPDRAGFIVNALLFPYLNEAVRMLEAHYVTADDIEAMVGAGTYRVDERRDAADRKRVRRAHRRLPRAP